MSMCEKGSRGCIKGQEGKEPKAPDGDPRNCSPDEIRECHGDVKEHPCVPEADKAKE